MKKLTKIILNFKKTSAFIAIIILIVIISVLINVNNKSNQTQYIFEMVKLGNIEQTITGTGQVSSLNQVDIKSKVSGDIIYINALSGQEIKKGALIAQIDASEALNSLKSAELSMAKLIKPANQSEILSAENSLTSAQVENQNAIENLKKAYDDGFNSVSNAFLDLPDILLGLNSLLNNQGSNPGYLNDSNVRATGKLALTYRDNALTAYYQAKKLYDQNLKDYKLISRSSSTSSIETLINQTYETVKITADTVKESKTAVDFLRENQNQGRTSADESLADIASWTAMTNSHLNSLLSIKNSILENKESIESSKRDIAQKKESLNELINGPDELDIKSEELSLEQKRKSYNEYFIRAPIDGIIAKVNVKKYENISGGTTVATIITKNKIAEISLNEVDAAKVKIGQSVKLTFDALEDLSAEGKVEEIDLIGTVNQGVVTYNTKISFETDDSRIKPGMTTSATITTEKKENVLVLPNEAIKNIGTKYYVEYLDNQTERRMPIEIGTADDINTQIISGIDEDFSVITKKISATQTQTNQNSRTIFGTQNRSGTGSVRIAR